MIALKGHIEEHRNVRVVLINDAYCLLRVLEVPEGSQGALHHAVPSHVES